MPVGCEDGTLPDDSFTSSVRSSSGAPSAARLNDTRVLGWRPDEEDGTHWLQIDLLSVRLVTGVATQGNSKAAYVTSYLLYHGLDGIHWITYFNISKLPLVSILIVTSDWFLLAVHFRLLNILNYRRCNEKKTFSEFHLPHYIRGIRSLIYGLGQSSNKSLSSR